MRVLRKRRSALRLNASLVAGDQLGPIVGVEIGVEHVAVDVLVLVEDFFEHMMLEPQHHVAIHGDEAPVGIIRETTIAGVLRQRLDGDIVEAEIEHGIHHAGHRRARTRAHRDEQRIVRIPKDLAARDCSDREERGFDFALERLGIGLVMTVEVAAHLGRDGEAGRHRQPEICHLSEISALAAEQIAHLRPALGLAAAKGVHPFGGWSLGASGFDGGGFGQGGFGGEAFRVDAQRSHRGWAGSRKALAGRCLFQAGCSLWTARFLGNARCLTERTPATERLG